MNKTEIIENYIVNYKKHIFSKSIKITLKANNLILVTLPYFCPYKNAKDFLIDNFDKIKSYRMPNPKTKEEIKELRKKAKNYLPKRIEEIAKQYNFKYNKLALRNQKTRFGSCSCQNNINLNINLMNYDTDVIDYVIIHELVHTKIKNHSKTFWGEVEKYCPDYKYLRKKLKSAKQVF